MQQALTQGMVCNKMVNTKAMHLLMRQKGTLSQDECCCTGCQASNQLQRVQEVCSASWLRLAHVEPNRHTATACSMVRDVNKVVAYLQDPGTTPWVPVMLWQHQK